MWRDLIQGLAAECKFNPPASPDDIADVENALGISSPLTLKELLEESNGVYGEDDSRTWVAPSLRIYLE